MTEFLLAGHGMNKVRPEADLALRCPSCRQTGTFDPVDREILDAPVGALFARFGQRKCPNPNCQAHVFVVIDSSNLTEALVTYPPEVMDFDSSSIPSAVRESMEEALQCHAHGLHRSAGMMIRHTLEALCSDKEVEGNDLYSRLEALGDEIVVPRSLLDGIQNLRLLGNDAAHVESRHYDEVGEEQIEVALEFTKEILKATYQYSDLVRRLEGLRSDTTPEASE